MNQRADMTKVDGYCIAPTQLPSCALLLNAILPTINHIHSILSQNQIGLGCRYHRCNRDG